MQFLAAFFEHFVVGIFAVFCFSVFLINPDLPEEYVPLVNNLENIKELIAVVLLPVAYLIGVFIDAFASVSGKIIKWLVKMLHKKIRSIVNDNTANQNTIQDQICIFLKFKNYLKSNIFGQNSYARTVKILKNDECSDELARYFLQLNSRQKTTRGIVFVQVIATFYSVKVYGFFTYQFGLAITLCILSIIGNIWHTYTLENFKNQLVQ